MRLAILAGALLLVSGAGPGTSARAETICGPAEQVDAGLRQQYGESPVAEATTAGGHPLTIYANLTTGTWTSVIHTEAGIACLAAAGEDWRLVTAAQAL